MDKHFINLTNGIEAIPFLDNYEFVRIPSSYCETKSWDNLLFSLDSNFLMNLAVGNTCIIYDYSQNKEMPRALYQGVEYIKFVLYKRWFNVDYKPMVNHNNCFDYFNSIRLSVSTKRKIDYFKKFLYTDKLNIKLSTGKTNFDGNYQYYKDILINDVKERNNYVRI